MTIHDPKKKQSFFDGIKQAARFMAFANRNGQALKARGLVETARTTLALANMELAKMDCRHPLQARRIWEFDQVMVSLTQGKWFAARAMQSGDKADWAGALAQLRQANAEAESLHHALLSGSEEPLPISERPLAQRNSEILFAGDVPIVPPINPIILLQGSDFEMGRQYARQVVEIFGKWVFARQAGQPFSEAEKLELSRWEAQMQQHAPEMIGFCQGWAAGAVEAGVPIRYEDVLNIWTGCRPPARDYFGLDGGLPDDLHPPACSGHAAWGRATRDGRLVCGSSGDHDCGYMATLVVYPESGYPFIYTPFSVTGDLPKIGPVYMMGHPGMNNQGLAYVHHGGAPKMIEAQQRWGYGIRLGTAVFHILRFARSAEEARQMEASFPIGDVGDFSGVGYPGGFWADEQGGFVTESRQEPEIVRTAGQMGETDFLLANNSALSRAAEAAGWLQSNRHNWGWDEHAGWYPKTLSFGTGLSAVGQEAQTQSLFAYIYLNSFGRNRYAFEQLNAGLGQIDADFMRRLYCTAGSLPEGDWKRITQQWRKTGAWGEYASGHASNALVAVMQPERGEGGRYALCVGTAKRGLPPHSPTGATPIYGETNAFWEVRLASSPSALTAAARQTAEQDAAAARARLEKMNPQDAASARLQALLDAAEADLSQPMPVDGEAADYARAVRAYTRAQVRTRQIVDALE